MKSRSHQRWNGHHLDRIFRPNIIIWGLRALHNVYDDINPNHNPFPAEYNLKFLWRDLTSDFDVIGPYFSSAKSYDHTFVITAIRETMRIFHACNFLLVSLVCDEASTNLAHIKLMCFHRRGTFGINPEHADTNMVQPWLRNHFYPTLNVYYCICPPHQLKKYGQCLTPIEGNCWRYWTLQANRK